VSLSTEWNEECDYVTIANEAERELRRNVSDQDPTATLERFASPATTHRGLPPPTGATGVGGELSHKFKERLAAVQRLHSPMDPSSFDRQAASFYASQADLIIVEVRSAVDRFFRAHHTPIDFTPCARSVILSAHKLVYVAEALSRIMSSDVSDIVVSANTLCNALKAAVTATKHAALGFDDASTLQCMEHCVTGAVADAEDLLDVIRRNVARI